MEKNIFDEEVYLNHDEQALKVFKDIRNKEFIIPYFYELKTYKSLFKEYYKFIDKVAELLKCLNLQNSIEYSIALNYLIQNGYLSNNLTFNRGESSNELCSNLGINIVLGEGVCRNFSDFHRHVMETLGEYAKRFYCVSNFSMRKARTMKANHVLNLVKYDDTLYGIDLYNHNKLYKFFNSFTLEEISHYSSDKLRYKPYYEMLVSGISLDGINKEINIFEIESKKKHLSPFEYSDTIFVHVFENLLKYRDLFKDFHHDTKNLKENIYESMTKRLKK